MATGQTIFCTKCGRALHGQTVCVCGHQVQAPAAPQPLYQPMPQPMPQPALQVVVQPGSSRKEPWLAALLNLFFPGAGYWYLGHFGMGLTRFVVFCLLSITLVGGFIYWIWIMKDCYRRAEQYNLQIPG